MPISASRQTPNDSGPEDPVYAVAFSTDGKLLASTGDDQAIQLWDVAKRAGGPRLKGHRDAGYAVAFSPTDDLLASGSADKMIRLWPRRAFAP